MPDSPAIRARRAGIPGNSAPAHRAGLSVDGLRELVDRTVPGGSAARASGPRSRRRNARSPPRYQSSPPLSTLPAFAKRISSRTGRPCSSVATVTDPSCPLMAKRWVRDCHSSVSAGSGPDQLAEPRRNRSPGRRRVCSSDTGRAHCQAPRRRRASRAPPRFRRNTSSSRRKRTAASAPPASGTARHPATRDGSHTASRARASR